jgi:hypothetical protein
MRWKRVAAVGVVILAVAGCSAGPVGSTQVPEPSASVSAAPPSSAPPLLPDPVVPDCAAAVASGIDRTVTAQLAAFADGDFRSAFALASESFRGSIDLRGFREVILTGYPEVAAAVDHRVVECRQPGPGSVSALIAVTGENGVTAQLAYRFVLESGEWRVDGAATLATKAVQTV